MLQLHKLEVPQCIGTTLIRDSVVSIIPFATIPFTATTSRVFKTLEEYMYALIEARRATEFIGTKDADRSNGNAVLDRLREGVRGRRILLRNTSRVAAKLNGANGVKVNGTVQPEPTKVNGAAA